MYLFIVSVHCVPSLTYGDTSRSWPYASASFGMPPGEVAVIGDMSNDLSMFKIVVGFLIAAVLAILRSMPGWGASAGK